MLTTHSALPEKLSPDDTQFVAVFVTLERDLRYSGGMMSARAAMRSLSDSSRSEAAETSLASESAVYAISVWMRLGDGGW